MRATVTAGVLMLSGIAVSGCLGSEIGGDVAPSSILPPVPNVACRVGGCNPLVSGGVANTNEPSIAANPTDPSNLVAGANDYSQPLGGSWCGAYRSLDGGRTWKADLLPGYPGDARLGGLTGFDFCGDAVLAFDSKGTVYYSGIAFHRLPRAPVVGAPACVFAAGVCAPDPFNVQIFVAKSQDKGETWTDFRIVSPGYSTLRFNDKNWIAVDLATGTLYLAWTIYEMLPTSAWVATEDKVPDPLAKGEIFFSKSEDAGDTWTSPVRISEGTTNQGAVPVVASDGTLYVAWNADDPDELPAPEGPPIRGTFAFVKSTDRGETFGAPQRFGHWTAIPSPLPNAFFRTGTLPGFAVDASDGPRKDSLYLVYNDWNREEQHSDIRLVASRDGGKTWSEPVRVNDDDTRTDQWMPNVAVDSAGTVHVTWLDRRDDAANTLYHAYAGASRDGGRTFANARVTDAASDPLAGQETDPVTGEPRRLSFIGDYLQVAAVGEKAYSVFPDLRESGPAKRLVNVLLSEVSLGPQST